MTCLVSRSAGCTCWKVPLDNKVLDLFLNSLTAILLPLAIMIVLPWLLCLVGPPRSKCMCAAAPLSGDSGKFSSLMDLNSSASRSISSIRVRDIDSISGVAVNNSSCLIGVQAAILFEELLSWYDKSSTIV